MDYHVTVCIACVMSKSYTPMKWSRVDLNVCSKIASQSLRSFVEFSAAEQSGTVNEIRLLCLSC